MANPNALNPSFSGNVKANSFSTPIGASGTFGGWAFKKLTATSGANRVPVFGTTNGFEGTLLSARITAGSDGNGTVDVAGTNGTVCRIVKGSAGVTSGCYIRISGISGTAFTSTGCLFVTNNGLNDCLVELTFVVRENQ